MAESNPSVETRMPLFAVLLEDEPERASEIRRLHMSAHIEFLERNAAAIRAAGPLHDGAAGQLAGGLWLVESHSAEAVKILTQEDPFWPAGLRRSIRVLEWRRVFANGR
jgi:uncharacterized protein